MLTFEPVSHSYFWNGAHVPSVTQILEDCGIIDYSFLPPGTREMALKRGSDVHTACHFDDENDLAFEEGWWVRDREDYERTWNETGVGLDPRLCGYVVGWRKFRREKEFIPSLIEHRAYNEKYGFAGTLDRSGTFKMNGGHADTLLDIKCGDCPPWWVIQTGFYGSFFESPRRFMRLGVELHKAGTYRLFTREGRYWQEDFNRGLCYLQTYRDKREFNQNSYRQRHRKGSEVQVAEGL